MIYNIETMKDQCIIILVMIIIGFAIYYSMQADDDKVQALPDKSPSDELEYFDQDLLENVISDKTSDADMKDYIKEWDETFNKCPPKKKNKKKHVVIDDDTEFAQFTSNGKNYNNNLTQFNSADLLPSKEIVASTDIGWDYKNSDGWSESNPQIKEIKGNSWLNGDRFMGMYSVSSSLRNASHDIRCEPSNPQLPVGPWNNTTILPSSICKDDCSI